MVMWVTGEWTDRCAGAREEKGSMRRASGDRGAKRGITPSPDGASGKWSRVPGVPVAGVYEADVNLLLPGLLWRQRQRSVIKGWQRRSIAGTGDRFSVGDR